MIMRSGKRYRSVVEEAVMAEGVAEVSKAFMEDRKQREEELRTREAEMREKRRRRDEEIAQREEELRRQMDLLQSLVEGMMKQSEATSKKSDSRKDVRVAKLTEQDDIEAYLTTFERLMIAYEVPEEQWTFMLAPQLVGKAQQAYAGLSADEAYDYKKLKSAVLQRYDITEESY